MIKKHFRPSIDNIALINFKKRYSAILADKIKIISI
jgi:hypothetical protein